MGLRHRASGQCPPRASHFPRPRFSPCLGHLHGIKVRKDRRESYALIGLLTPLGLPRLTTRVSGYKCVSARDNCQKACARGGQGCAPTGFVTGFLGFLSHCFFRTVVTGLIVSSVLYLQNVRYMP